MISPFAFPVFNDARKTLLAWAPFLRKVGNAEGYVGGEFEMQNWHPTIVGNGTLTLSAINIHFARYQQVGKMVWVSLYVDFTTGGIADISVEFSLPVTVRAAISGVDAQHAPVHVEVGAGVETGVILMFSGTNVARAYRPATAAWTLGASRLIAANFFYEAN